MELEIEKYSKEGNDSKNYEVSNFRKVSENANVLLVFDGFMSFSRKDESINQENKFFTIFKIQFFAVCDISISKNVFLAFYIDECGQLKPYIITDLPGNYHQSETSMGYIIDYKAYKDICELTGEKVMTFENYIEKIIAGGNQCINSLLKYENKFFNFDNQDEVFDLIEGAVI